MSKCLGEYDVIVVGGASAGLTAALYTSRQGLNTLVITKDIGGQALLTDEIQNYPGFISISGFELMNRFKEHAEAYGATFVYDEVVALDAPEDSCFVVKTRNAEYTATAVILAFGKTPRDLGVPGEQELKGRGVSYCAVCDGPLFKGKTVAVVGVGEPALDAVNLLSNLAKKVYYVFRTAAPIADEESIANAKRENVEFVPNSVVNRIVGEKTVKALELSNVRDGSHSTLSVDGVFIEMGYVTKTEFLRGVVELNSKGEIIVDKMAQTSREGVFAAGDVTDTPYKQAVISAGMGAVAALSAYNYVQRIRGRHASAQDWKKVKPKTQKQSAPFVITE